MSFDEIFDLTAGVYFNFYNNVETQRGVPSTHEGIYRNKPKQQQLTFLPVEETALKQA